MRRGMFTVREPGRCAPAAAERSAGKPTGA